MKTNALIKIFLLAFLSFALGLFAEENQIRKVSSNDFVFDNQPEEGYFQGWNFYFINKDFNIFVTFLVSNLGPNDLNNGVSMVIQSKKTGTKFYTKEFGVKNLQATKGKFYQRSYDNFMLVQDGKCEIFINVGEAKLHLKYLMKPEGVALSGGRYFVKPPNKFVRADIPFAFSEVTGVLTFQKEDIFLAGEGGMEHLNTNYEVYKYSKRWEILRAKTNDGLIFSGGFIGNENFPGEFFRTIAIVGSNGEILLSGVVRKSEIVTSAVEPFSDYNLPVIEKLFLSADDSCTVTTERKETLGKIYILSNISPVLRFFVRLFFAKPYQIHFKTIVKVNCVSKIPSIEAKGIHSYYLINK